MIKQSQRLLFLSFGNKLPAICKGQSPRNLPLALCEAEHNGKIWFNTVLKIGEAENSIHTACALREKEPLTTLFKWR